jgi:hypothetical protein
VLEQLDDAGGKNMILLCKFVYIQQKIFSLSKLPTVGEAVKLNAKKKDYFD